MILISEEKYNRLMNRRDPEKVETPVIQKGSGSVVVKRKLKKQKKPSFPPPGEPASKKARRVLNYKQY